MNLEDRVELAFNEFSERSTTQRQEIANRILAFGKSGESFTAEMLLSQLRKKYPGIGRATVFRVMDNLYRISLLDRIDFADGERRYSLCNREGHHHHLACNVCHKIVEIDLCLPSNDIERIGEAKGFKIDNHEIPLFGECNRCRKRQGKGKSHP